MSALKLVAIYDRLRQGPLWKLLAAGNAPIILALLQSNLLENESILPGSVLRDRLSKDIEDLRASGIDLPQTAQGYVSDWLANGWLTRRFPADASEEEYELSGDAARAIRMVGGLVETRTVATESRLSLVIQSLDGLARATDPDPESRLASLEEERAEIERKIEAVREGHVDTLSEDRAIERVREIISLAGELASDFHRVREHFEGLIRFSPTCNNKWMPFEIGCRHGRE